MSTLKLRSAIVLALALAATAPALAGRPTVFDFMEYERKLREASPTPHLHPWLAATIKNISVSKRRLTFVHAPTTSAGMPTMTMTLDTAPSVHLGDFRVGDLVDVQIDNHSDRVWIIGLRQRR